MRYRTVAAVTVARHIGARRLSNAASGIKGATHAIAERMGKVDVTSDEEVATLVKVHADRSPGPFPDSRATAYHDDLCAIGFNANGDRLQESPNGSPGHVQAEQRGRSAASFCGPGPASFGMKCMAWRLQCQSLPAVRGLGERRRAAETWKAHEKFTEFWAGIGDKIPQAKAVSQVQSKVEDQRAEFVPPHPRSPARAGTHAHAHIHARIHMHAQTQNRLSGLSPVPIVPSSSNVFAH